jgi:hypothetical protein
MPGMNYTMVEVGEGTGGGMQSRPMPEAHTGWLPYVTVDDVKQTMAKAAKAGATPLLEYQDIGDMGAIGIFKDPLGSPIGVWAAKKIPAVAKISVARKKKATKKVAKAATKKVAKAAKKVAKTTKKVAKAAKKKVAKAASKTAKAAKKTAKKASRKVSRKKR